MRQTPATGSTGYPAPRRAFLPAGKWTVLFAAALAAVACSDGPAEPPGDAPGISVADRLVFISERGGSLALWTTRPDGQDPRRITADLTYNGGYAAGRNGEVLFIVRDGDHLVEMNVATGAARGIATLPSISHIHWNAATGRVLVSYADAPTATSRIAVVTPLTGRVSPVLTTPVPSGDAEWSPDGEWIVFTSAANDTTLRLYVIRPDGTGLRPLTTGGAGSSDISPMWSPAGDVIVFSRYPWDNGPERVGFVTLAGDEPTFLPAPDGLWSPRFSPDGTELVVERGRCVEAVCETNLWRVRRDGSGLTQVTHGALNVHPIWVPPDQSARGE